MRFAAVCLVAFACSGALVALAWEPIDENQQLLRTVCGSRLRIVSTASESRESASDRAERERREKKLSFRSGGDSPSVPPEEEAKHFVTELHPALEENLRERGFVVTGSGQESAAVLRVTVTASWHLVPGSGAPDVRTSMPSTPVYSWEYTASLALVNAPSDGTEPNLLIDRAYPGGLLGLVRSGRTGAALKLAGTLARKLDEACRELQPAK
jgi:hypothetical protein